MLSSASCLQLNCIQMFLKSTERKNTPAVVQEFEIQSNLSSVKKKNVWIDVCVFPLRHDSDNIISGTREGIKIHSASELPPCCLQLTVPLFTDHHIHHPG